MIMDIQQSYFSGVMLAVGRGDTAPLCPFGYGPGCTHMATMSVKGLNDMNKVVRYR